MDTPAESNGHHEESTSHHSSSAKKFLFKNSDIIFENELIQVGIKGESTNSPMRIELYYGNKTNSHLTHFSADIFTPGDLQTGKTSKLSPLFT